MPLTLTITSEPAIEPVTLAEAKAHLRVDDTVTAEDDYVTGLITAARLHAEAFTDRQFITATYVYRLDAFPNHCDPIRVPRPNLISVTSIAYTDEDGTTQTLSASDYQVDALSLPGRITPAYGSIWPATRAQMNAVVITYTAGYGATATTVPAPIRHAIKMLVSQWFENREPVVVGTIASELPLTVKALLGPYRAGTVY